MNQEIVQSLATKIAEVIAAQVVNTPTRPNAERLEPRLLTVKEAAQYVPLANY
jgi:hypothetical protein